MKNKYLIVCDQNTGFTELSNVGIISADNKEEAIKKGQVLFNCIKGVLAFEINQKEEWSYYV